MKQHQITKAKYPGFLLLICLTGFIATAQPVPVGELNNANSEIGFLKGEKGNTVALLATVKEEIKVFDATVRDPHNKDAANQKAAMAAAEAAPYDAYSKASVDAHNDAINAAAAWGKRVEERRLRETPRYVEMKKREAEYEKSIADLSSRIKAIISRYSPNCATDDTEEGLVNCWAIYFDGESKRKALGEEPVYPGTNFFGSGVPTVSSDAFKTFRNEQLMKINSGINKTFVPAPPPPPKGMIEKATEQTIDYFKQLIYGKDKYKARRTTAVLAVRG